MEFHAPLSATPALARCFLHPHSLGAGRNPSTPRKCHRRDRTFLPGRTVTSHRRTLHHGVNHSPPSGVLRVQGGLSPSQRPLETLSFFYGCHKGYLLICTPAGLPPLCSGVCGPRSTWASLLFAPRLVWEARRLNGMAFSQGMGMVGPNRSSKERGAGWPWSLRVPVGLTPTVGAAEPGGGCLRWLLPSGSPDQHLNPASADRTGFPGRRRAHVQGPRTSHQACNSLMPRVRSRLTSQGTASTQHPARQPDPTAAGPVRVPRPPSVPRPRQIQQSFYFPNLPTQSLSPPADLAALGWPRRTRLLRHLPPPPPPRRGTVP